MDMEKRRFERDIGMRFGAVEPGRATGSIAIEDRHRNGTGVVHGGVMFTLADSLMGAALYKQLEDGEICATVEIKIGYFKPVFEGTLECEAVLINKGKSIASLEATIMNEGKLVSKCSGTFSIFRKKSEASFLDPKA
jgi:acyl-CoA thioesterase